VLAAAQQAQVHYPLRRMLAAAGRRPQLKQLHSLLALLLRILHQLRGFQHLQAAVIQHSMCLALVLVLVAALRQQELSAVVLQLVRCQTVCLELLQRLPAQAVRLVALLLPLAVVVQQPAAEPL
jgi:hypothetical protein